MKFLRRVSLSLLLFAPLPAQSTDALLTGNVLDPAGTSVPGATVTAWNTKTGVATGVKSNTAGVYLFAALQPGEYSVTVERNGFRKLVLAGQTLRTGDHVNLNLSLEVGQTSDSVDVTANAEAVNALTASPGGTLGEKKILELPAVTRNVMDLITTQAGLITTSYGANINGSRTDMTNVTLDAVNMIDNFITSSSSSTQVWASVDRIEEFKVITSPVDAEYGRGSGQVQLISRSGTNEYHGSVYDYLRNTRLNANTWANNRSGTPRNTLNQNDVVGRIGGPIRKNKTFFFVMLEPQIQRFKTSTNATVPTDSLRQGIYRFFPGVANANANASTAVVDLLGNAVQPAKATGPLQTVSLFGLDPNRMAADSTGIVKKFLDLAPAPNNWIVGDGLNTAGYLWRIPQSDDTYSTNVRIDQYFSDRGRVSVSYSHDAEDGPNEHAAQPLPNSPMGEYKDSATVVSANLTSVLKPTVVNVATFGLSRAQLRYLSPWIVSGTGILPVLDNIRYDLSLGSVTSPIPTASTADPQGRVSPVYEFKDKINWSRGVHQVKAGVERRYISSNEFTAFYVVPRVNLGTASGAPTQNIATIPNIGSNATGASALLSMLTGSVGSVTQYFNSPGGANPQFVTGETSNHTWREAEWSAWAQDDIKLRPNFTLNLGLRWEYYGVPYEANGKLNGLAGGSSAIFGLSGTNLGSLFQPGVMNGSLTQFQLIGKDSPHPEAKVWNPDYNNLAPSIGFSWGIPWLDQNKTVLRAGYAISYERSALVLLSQIYGYNQPGLSNTVTYTPTSYAALGSISLPLTPSATPMATIPVNGASSAQTVRVVDNNLRTPCIQNWNVSLGRDLAKGIVLDVRYVGSKGTKLVRGGNIDEINIFENGFLNAFKTTQAGGNAPLFDQFFNGLSIPGAGPTGGTAVVNGATISGSDAVRRNGTMQQYLVNNDVGGLAYYIATTVNYTGMRGGLIANAKLPANFFMANPQFGSASFISNFGNSIYHSGQVEVTKRFEHGISVQGSYVFSKTLGDYDGNQQNQYYSFMTMRNRRLDRRLLSFDVPTVLRTSALWELPFGHRRKFLGNAKSVLNKLVEGWTTGVIFDKLAGIPTGFSSGATSSGYNPGDTFNLAAYATPVAMGPIPMNSLQVQKAGNNVIGLRNYTQVTDPAALALPGAQLIQVSATSERSLSAMSGLQGPNGNLILVNPAPGTLGMLNPTNIRGLGTFRFDVQISKVFSVAERYRVTLRADGQNILNRPIWANPTLNINSTSFGQITSATGNRQIGVSARIEF